MPDSYPSRKKFELKFVKPEQGRTLIVGSRLYEGREDRRLRYPDAVGVDMLDGPGVDIVQDLEGDIVHMGLFAHIECLSVLEHSRRPWLLAANLERMLAPGGTLFLSVPFVWRFHAYDSDYFRFTHRGVESLFPAIRWEHLEYASNRLNPKSYLRAITSDDHPYLPRTEVVGWGIRK